MKIWRILPLLAFGILAVFLGRGLFLHPQELPTAQLGQALPDFKLPVLNAPNAPEASEENATSIPYFTKEALLDKIAIVNVWASWCKACSEEQTLLLQLADVGVPIFGINYKDNEQQARDWLATWGNPYRLIGMDKTGDLGIDLGVYGTPETFLIDQHGLIRFRHAGILNMTIWQAEFLPRIKQLREEEAS